MGGEGEVMLGRRDEIYHPPPAKGLHPPSGNLGHRLAKRVSDFLCRAGQAGQHLPGGPRFPKPAPASDCVDSCSREFVQVAAGKPTVPTPRDAAHPGPPPRVSVEQGGAGARRTAPAEPTYPTCCCLKQPPVLMLREPDERFSAEP